MRETTLPFVFLCCLAILILPQIHAFSSTLSPNRLSPLPGSVSSRALPHSAGNKKRSSRTLGLLGVATNREPAASGVTVLEPYEYDGWKLTYRTIAEEETESTPGTDYHNVLLIHPVGIGLASWFWEPFMTKLREKSSKNNFRIRVYAPNLIGCGISEGSDAWDPDQRGMFVPLGWTKGCEALVNHINDSNEASTKPPKWTVVTQGGLAPVGVLFAARNPELVQRLVLTSPPTWKDMTSPVPKNELERNYNFLRSPLLGKLAFSLLENRALVKFFTNQFLFSKECDDVWLDKTDEESCEEARPPVQSFNAGMCMNRSFERELLEEIQTKIPSVVVIQGEDDKRPRQEYKEKLSNCELVTIEGTTNVVPWEDPEAMAELMLERLIEDTAIGG